MQNNKIDEEPKVHEYIKNHFSVDDYFDKEIAQEEAFEVHYHLSSLRRGILSWYDFNENSSLLEIGAGYGALTGMFCEKCAEVIAVEANSNCAEALAKRHDHYNNLEVICGDWRGMEFGRKFDYVVFFDAIQCDTVFLNQIVKMLKPSGRLLITYENCFGLKYMCGMPDHHTGKVFEGITNYAKQTERCSFGRGEICKVIGDSAFKKYKFYYPLPDARFPQVIYSDTRLPEVNVTERLLPYYENIDTLMCKEGQLYEEVISQGAFPFMANSFLIECSLDGNTSDISYAAVSSDRGKTRAFATTIHQSGLVCKRPLYQEGKKSVTCIYENTIDLLKHGIPVVPHTYEEKYITLPFIKHPTLADYLRKQIPKEPEIFIKVLRDLYSFILQASELVESSQNAMLFRMCQSFGEQYEVLERLEVLEWGPILRKAYIELVPLNCFFDETFGKYQFFDQEFVRENYPAGYILFRTITICYRFIPNLEVYVPLQQVKDTFGLNHVWEFYEKEEALFLDEVRLRATYVQFLKWTFCELNDIGLETRKWEYECGRKAGRQLILFGTGKIFNAYCANCNKYGTPVFAVDNDSTKWGQVKNGIEIRNPKAILEVAREKRQVLICCLDTASIEEQLQRMGVREYWKYCDIIG